MNVTSCVKWGYVMQRTSNQASHPEEGQPQRLQLADLHPKFRQLHHSGIPECLECSRLDKFASHSDVKAARSLLVIYGGAQTTVNTIFPSRAYSPHGVSGT